MNMQFEQVVKTIMSFDNRLHNLSFMQQTPNVTSSGWFKTYWSPRSDFLLQIKVDFAHQVIVVSTTAFGSSGYVISNDKDVYEDFNFDLYWSLTYELLAHGSPVEVKDESPWGAYYDDDEDFQEVVQAANRLAPPF